MLTGPALLDALRQAPRIRVEGAFWRTVLHQHLLKPPPGAPPGTPPQPLWPGGPALRGARFTRTGGGDALYLAPDAATALAEVEAVVFGAHGVRPGPAHDPLLVFAVEVLLPETLDLCDPHVQRLLGTSDGELTAPWLRTQERHRAGRGPLPATQALGEAARETECITALRYPSHRHAGVRNVVVFTDRLAATGGRVSLVDGSGTHVQSLP